MNFTFGQAQDLAQSLLVRAGMQTSEANRCAWAIASGDIVGRGSHGMLRLPHYLRRLESGAINPNARLETISDTGPVIALDGNDGLGHFEVYEAAELACKRAMGYGVAAVSVRNSSHCGVLGLYTLPMVRQSLIGLVFSNGPAVMPAWEGNRPILSTSPIACGIPTTPGPTIIDLATSTVARGKIAEAAAEGVSIPDGWAFDMSGQPTNDPNEALKGMLSPMSGAKGFALALMVEALTGGMVGPNLSTGIADALSKEVAHIHQGVSHLVIALNPTVFDPSGKYEERLEELASSVSDSGGRLPGSAHAFPDESGPEAPLTIADSVANELAAYADKYSVDLPSGWPTFNL